MKTKSIIAGMICISALATAQPNWSTSGSLIYSNPISTALVGIGTNGTGSYTGKKLEVHTSNAGSDGIRIRQNGTSGSAALRLSNGTAGGKEWSVFSSGNGDACGSGYFGVYNESVGSFGMVITPTTGLVGFGTISPSAGKVHVETLSNGSGINTAGYFQANGNGTIDYYGVHGKALSTNSQASWLVGVKGEAISQNGCNGQNMAFWGEAKGAPYNFGGIFIGGGNNPNCCVNNVGVWGTASIIGSCANDWAGWFNGDVGYTGVLVGPSDRKLKENIKPLDNMMSKIMQLKPASYTYKTTGEYEAMGLPKGQQLGLIAQELEEVFPELIKEVGALKAKSGETEVSSAAFKGVQYTPLIPVLIKGMQEQQELIVAQSKINADLQNQISEQKDLISTLNQKLSGATGVQNESLNSFKMGQNEPNPFTVSSQIGVSLSNNVKVARLVIYDLSGKQLQEREINERGNFNFTITSENLSAGMYIYTIIADEKVMDSKRMIISSK